VFGGDGGFVVGRFIRRDCFRGLINVESVFDD
jgi:hypothetical protein